MAHLRGGGQQVMDINFWSSEEKDPWETVTGESGQVQTMPWSNAPDDTTQEDCSRRRKNFSGQKLRHLAFS